MLVSTSRTPGKSVLTPSRCKTPGKNPVTPGTSVSYKTPKALFTPGTASSSSSRSCGNPCTGQISTIVQGKYPAVRHKTPKALFTPGKQLSGKTPNKKSTMTPGKQQDRFIPNRMTTNQEMSHFALVNEREDGEGKEENPPTEYQQQLSQAMLSKPASNVTKILSFRNICSNKLPTAPKLTINNLNVLYSAAKVPTKTSVPKRQIPSKPENVLDAPSVTDDYYLHTLDWSGSNLLAAALGCEVFLWNATTSTITRLMNTPDTDYLSAVSWLADSSFLAVGLSDGNVQIWDVENSKLMRTMSGHSDRVGVLDWNAHILTSGCRSGGIHHHDVRVASHHVATLSSHIHEVCGLKWSPDGQYLASGGNDNTVYIWDASLGMSVSPVHTFTDHQAAVKAISWCPWQTRQLATGGGMSDGHIRFWNTNTGTCIKSVDTQSQVCSILWSKEHREIVSGHGYVMNQLSIWKYPAMTKVTDLIGHSGRILNLCMSPDGQTVGSIAADETIRLWKCFAVDKTKEKKLKSASSSSAASATGLRTCIR